MVASPVVPTVRACSVVSWSVAHLFVFGWPSGRLVFVRCVGVPGRRVGGLV